MAKKSAAQIRRLQKRAASRGETYVAPPEETTKETETVKGGKDDCSNKSSVDGDAEDDRTRRLSAARKLQEALSSIESNEEMNSKERRSAKRKAEAIIAEESGCDASSLLKWYKEDGGNGETEKKKKRPKKKTEDDRAKKSSDDGAASEEDEIRRLCAARKLQETLSGIDSNEEMNAKERRSAKRKAEAIAAEESGCDASSLLKWYEENGENGEADTEEKNPKKSHTPYVLFVGQLSYNTTKEGLFQHFQKELGKDVVTSENLTIRLLTDPKTKRSRGMAFVETINPEIMYVCLQMHHTSLDGRCINVERSAGGKKGSETRKGKIAQFRKEQEEYMSNTVDKIISDFKSRGDITEGELDDGVVALCKRHSAATVETALAEYVEERGESLDNPSAYLTSILCRVAAGKARDERSQYKSMNRRQQKNGEDTGKRVSNGLQMSSELGKAGVDMSISSKGNSKTGSTMSRIFPSMTRGRGRGRGGRGYMF